MRSKHALLVAHNQSPIIARSVTCLQKHGYDVIEADSGKTCAQLIAQQEPPLVLCHLNTEAFDGYERIQKIKSQGAGSGPFVVHFYEDQKDIPEVKGRSVIDEVLPLPSRPTELLAWVKMFFRFKEVKDFHRSIVENISDAVFLTDKLGHITYVCPNVNRIFQYTQDEVRQLGHISHLIDNALFSDDILEAQGEIENIKTVVVRKDGSKRTVLINLKKVDMEEGTHLYVCRDITKSIEHQKLKEQLQQVHKMEAVGTLAGGISHEFNNLLGIIMGNAELAADEIDSANLAQDFLIEIRTACRRAKDVVRKILSFARKTPYDPKPVRIDALVNEAVRFMRATIPTTIEISTDIRCREETLLADATEINQVLMNLFTNAAHAISDQQGKIEVRLSPLELDLAGTTHYNGLNPGAFVCLSIRDNGAGIIADDLDRIFEPYFTTKKVNQGTGMGLAIVYGIVKKHQGDIVVNSTEDEGTEVTVLLPVMAGGMNATAGTKDRLPTGTESVLVVDDEPAMVKMMAAVLKRLGYEVAMTTSSTKALAWVEESPDHFDLVITDMAMPGMAGDMLARNLIKMQLKAPIILCTGHSERIDEKSAKAMGISAFVLKPIEKGALAHTVRQVLDGYGKK